MHREIDPARIATHRLARIIVRLARARGGSRGVLPNPSGEARPIMWPSRTFGAVEVRLIDVLLPLLPELMCHREDALSVFVVHVTAGALAGHRRSGVMRDRLQDGRARQSTDAPAAEHKPTRKMMHMRGGQSLGPPPVRRSSRLPPADLRLHLGKSEASSCALASRSNPGP